MAYVPSINLTITLQDVETGLASTYSSTINTNYDNLEALVGNINTAINSIITNDIETIPQVRTKSGDTPPTRSDGRPMQ